MALYQNRGAPHRGSGPRWVWRDGAWVEDSVVRRGEVFEPTEEELVRFKHKLGPVGAVAPSPPSSGPGRTVEDAIENVSRYHTGGGWYEMPDGARVRGQDAAIEAYLKLDEAADGEDQ